MLTYFAVVWYAPKRNPATLTVEAEDAAEAAFNAWSRCNPEKNCKPLVRHERDAWYVDGTLVTVQVRV